MTDIKKLRILKGGMKGTLNRCLRDLDDFLLSASADQIKGKFATVTKSLATYDNYAQQVYGLLTITDDVEEEMSADLEYVEGVNPLSTS